MTDNVVSNKFTGDSSSAVRAIAELEKKVEDLGKTLTEGKSKAKAAATAAKEAAKAAEDASKKATDAAKADAAESRKVLRNWVNYNKQAEADAAASRKVYNQTIKELEQADLKQKRLAAKEKTRIAREVAKEEKAISESNQKPAVQMQEWLAGAVGVQAVYSAISSEIQAALQFQQELIEKTDEFGRKKDRHSRTFGVNAGLNPIESKEAQAAMAAAEIQTGIGQDRLEPSASELAGSGFDWRDASGKALVKTVQAAGVTGGGDLADVAGAIGLTMNAQGMEKTSENVEKVGRVTYALRKLGRTEMNSFKFLAPELSIAQDQPFEQNAALMSTFEDVADPAKAAGAFGSLHKRLRAPVKETIDALKMAGLKPEDVDFVGEQTPLVVQKLSTAYKNLDPTKRGDFIKGVAGGDYLGQTDYLLKNPGKFTEKLQGASDSKGYDEAIKFKFSGLDFAAETTSREKEQQLAAMAAADTTLSDQRDLVRIRRGMSHGRSNVVKGWGKSGRSWGMDAEFAESTAMKVYNPQTIADFAAPGLGGIMSLFGVGNDAKYAGTGAEARAITEARLGESQERLAKIMEENNKLVAENNKLMQSTTKPTATIKRAVPVNASE